MTADARAAAAVLAARTPGFTPRVGLILGSGLGGLADQVDPEASIAYADLPGFPRTSVEGHLGRLVAGTLGGCAIVCLQGRAHGYEGDGSAMLTPVRALRSAGCEILLVTNAAGCLVSDWELPSLMLITDHINHSLGNPLVGANDDDFGPRFTDMSGAYDPELRERLAHAADQLSIPLHGGIYVGCLGPHFETPAEIRGFRTLGADAVGMSTVPEVLIARHCGLRVAALSLLTNQAAGMGTAPISHDETLQAAERAASDLSRLIVGFLEGLSRSP